VIDLVTVVYSPEINLLKTQALSIQQRFKLEHVNKIYVVINDYPHVAELILKDWYGIFASTVEIILDWPWTDADDAHKELSLTHGWYKQQALKLLAVSKSQSEWCMVLDAKTWFIKDYNPEDFFTGHRARCNLIPTVDCFLDVQKVLENYFQTSNTGKTIYPAGVPALLKPSVVREITQTTQDQKQEDFLEYFIKHTTYYSVYGLVDAAITEFILYSVYILYKQLFDVYYTGESDWISDNLAHQESNRFEEFMRNLNDDRAVTASIHSRAFDEELSIEQKQRWVEFLNLKNLSLF